MNRSVYSLAMPYIIIIIAEGIVVQINKIV